jgi:crotonobetainyl-CoA:carnitine CoA-transferase CaiB-like acyl-CoA transferase
MTNDNTALHGIRVIELANPRGEFCGRLLAGLGADVIKVEPPTGAPSRRIGPFYRDVPGPERSLYYWHYNLGKRGVTLNLECVDGRELLRRLLDTADVVLESYPPRYLESRGLGYRDVASERQVWLSMTEFGQEGPYRDYAACDLTHLALGGQMMVSGYPPGEDGYDTPPIAPQMHQSEHIASDQACADVLAALYERHESGRGQYLDFSVHAAVNLCTENHLAWYLVARQVSGRGPQCPFPLAGDGVPIVTMHPLFPGEWERMAEMLAQDEDLRYVLDPEFADPVKRVEAARAERVEAAFATWVSRRHGEDIFVEAQGRGVAWAPIRRPHEGVTDPHFRQRGNFVEVEHPELGRRFIYAAAPWVSPAMRWRTGPRAPLLGEHNAAVYGGELGLSAAQILGLAESGAI